jgi:hypothetical protein
MFLERRGGGSTSSFLPGFERVRSQKEKHALLGQARILKLRAFQHWPSRFDRNMSASGERGLEGGSGASEQMNIEEKGYDNAPAAGKRKLRASPATPRATLKR